MPRIKPPTPTSALLLTLILSLSSPLPAAPSTYCNPMNIDYAYCPIPNFVQHGKHRTTADPVIVNFRGDYYLFSTNQWGYWWSSDLSDWTFVPRKFLKPQHKVYDELCAPGAWVMDDALYLIGSTHTAEFPIYVSRNPKRDDWSEAVSEFKGAAWDPAFFVDDDGRLYLYYGSSNAFPLYGCEIDRKTLQPIGLRQPLIQLNDKQHGWERFGEHNDNTFLRPFLEGAEMTRHNGRYYLQYAAPGTEFSGYADGVYVADKPLGPFTYQPHNPISYKPGGFARGAGHGSTFKDNANNYWRVATMTVCVKNNFERRLGLWPAGFDSDGVMYCDTAYGDYPTYLPRGKETGDQRTPRFTGWMLLNHNKPVTVSSTLGGLAPNYAVDEDIKTHWSAATSNKGEWIQSDLGSLSTVRAIQVNYADQDAEPMGKVPGLHHRYTIAASTDGSTWTMIIDKTNNTRDVPHDYVEFEQPVEARFIRMENHHVPTGRFALSGLRVFGLARGKAKPQPPQNFVALRGHADRRNAWLKWRPDPHATGYVIRAGIAPDKLYTSVMVHGPAPEYYFRAMTATRPYYFTIESFNESGLSPRTKPVKCD